MLKPHAVVLFRNLENPLSTAPRLPKCHGRCIRTGTIAILVYSAAIATGTILLNEGLTVPAGDWRAPASGAIISAVSGILAGLLGRPA